MNYSGKAVRNYMEHLNQVERNLRNARTRITREKRNRALQLVKILESSEIDDHLELIVLITQIDGEDVEFITTLIQKLLDRSTPDEG